MHVHVGFHPSRVTCCHADGRYESGCQGEVTADEMDALHKKGVKEFVAGIEKNNKLFFPPRLSFTTGGDTKVFQLTCQEVVGTRARQRIPALAYTGIVPGPEIRVTEGDKVRVVVRNDMRESTSVHWHGQHAPNAMDGVPFVTQPPITNGQTFTYEFVARPAGNHMYQSHLRGGRRGQTPRSISTGIAHS